MSYPESGLRSDIVRVDVRQVTKVTRAGMGILDLAEGWPDSTGGLPTGYLSR